MPQDLINLLKENSITLVTAESCTGGIIASLICEIAGASAVFDRGFITYTNQSKIDCLNVPAEIIEQHGAVSEQTAEAMAEGALANSEASVAISTTGIAGPTGGSEEKPVGLVHFAFAMTGQDTHTREEMFEGTREEIQYTAAAYALQTLQELIEG